MEKKVNRAKAKNAEKPKTESVVVIEDIETVAVEKPIETSQSAPNAQEVTKEPEIKTEEKSLLDESVSEKPLEEKSAEEQPMQEQPNLPNEPFIPMDEPKSRLPIILFFFTIVVATAVVAGGGMFLYLQVKDNKISIPHISTPTVAVTPTSIPTPTTVDISKFTVEVLNGSGISGAAAGAKSLLTSAGFTVSDIGNSPTSNFIKTIIATKKGIDPNFLQKLKDTLQKTYVLGDTTILSDTDATTHDAIVTIGSQKQ